MANFIGQVTIPAGGGKVKLASALPQGAGIVSGNLLAPLTASRVLVQQLQVQNNGASNTNMRFGDQSVSATRGIVLPPTSSDNLGAFINYSTFLDDWWVYGTTGGDLVDFLYIP